MAVFIYIFLKTNNNIYNILDKYKWINFMSGYLIQ
jgi:hypothetical protein